MGGGDIAESPGWRTGLLFFIFAVLSVSGGRGERVQRPKDLGAARAALRPPASTARRPARSWRRARTRGTGAAGSQASVTARAATRQHRRGFSTTAQGGWSAACSSSTEGRRAPTGS